jgi:SPX domain protein involved in polyphosphate accumulation
MQSIYNKIKDVLKLYDPISLDEMSDYKLLNRIDTKYICNVELLPIILEASLKEFKIQEINKERLFKYESLYFDTPNLKTYFDHHQGKRIRYKIRFRKYVDTGDVFLELKKKQSYNRTDKKRTEFELTSKMSEKHIKFLKNHIDFPENGLIPSIWTIFNRLTFAGINHLERVTIDTDICFKTEDSKEIHLPNMAIVEVKRSKCGEVSPLNQILKNLHIRPFGISKYILGNILLTPNIKQNRFRNKVVTVNKICHGSKYNY